MLDTGNILEQEAVEAATMLGGDAVARLLSGAAADGGEDRATGVSRTIGHQVRSAEARLDNAGIAVAELLISSLRSQRDLRLTAAFGQPAVEDFVSALESWREFRARTIAGHDKLYRVAGFLGTQVVAAGDMARPDAAVMPNTGG